MDDPSRRSSLPDQSNDPANININMNPNTRQHRNNLRISEANPSGTLEPEHRPQERRERLPQPNILRNQLLQNLANRIHDPMFRPPPGPQLPPPFVNPAARPYLPPHCFPPPLPPIYNTQGNLFHDDTAPMFQSRFGSSGSRHRVVKSPPLHHGRNQDRDLTHLQRFLMEEVLGNVVMAAKDIVKSRFLQDTLTHGSSDVVNMIFSETITDLFSLTIHPFGNHVVWRLFDVVDEHQLNQILDLLISDRRLPQICADDHGSKVVYKLVESVRVIEQKYKLGSALTSIAVSLTKTTNGHAVIEQVFKNLFPHSKPLLLYEIAENCLDIAQDKCGSHMLQRCFDEAEDENFDLLADPIIQQADTLSEHANANYVVQHLVEMRKREVNRKIAERLRGKFASMSMNKNGSNVVQKLVKYSGLREVAETVLTEILSSSDLLQVSQDFCGNFVVQAIIKVIPEGHLFDYVKADIKNNERQLENHLYGRNVVEAMNARLKAMHERFNIRKIGNV
ncbi:hypothetical protein TIFTF001_007121 [Ficus carica]|uniref:PUM-HD domain-containing protein n=1 Tax=Ficus carica TaxID=3494 RepID=A0AA87ZIS8_FICCA|nr:hypothetical protein TIFTF001_007121 [Ficus carica]